MSNSRHLLHPLLLLHRLLPPLLLLLSRCLCLLPQLLHSFFVMSHSSTRQAASFFLFLAARNEDGKRLMQCIRLVLLLFPHLRSPLFLFSLLLFLHLPLFLSFEATLPRLCLLLHATPPPTIRPPSPSFVTSISSFGVFFPPPSPPPPELLLPPPSLFWFPLSKPHLQILTPVPRV